MKPIFLLGEAFGANEAKTRTPFVGASGVELLRQLAEAGIITLTGEDDARIQSFWNGESNGTQLPSTHIDMIWRMHPEVYRWNVFMDQPPSNDLTYWCGTKKEGIPGYPALLKSKYLLPDYAHHLEALADELNEVDPNLVVCLGNTPLWALAGTTGITKIRGTTAMSTHTVTGFKFIATYHPAAVLRQWELRSTAIIDLMKARREAQFPEIRRPKREIHIPETVQDVRDFIHQYIKAPDGQVLCRYLSTDVETAGNQITELGLAPSQHIALYIPFRDLRKSDRNYWPTFDVELEVWGLVRGVLEDIAIKKIFQNGPYDIPFIWRSTGIKVFGAEEDTMLLHHALQPESLKALGFLGSIYTNERNWKGMRKFNQTIKRDD